jgi:glycosyltransferase involved in cell wall biosynthesis
MRIGMMLDAYKPYVSGVTNAVALLKRALEDMGHQVYIFTFGGLDYTDDEPRVIRSPGVPLTKEGYTMGLRYPLKARRTLYRMDVVHVHHPFLSGSLALRYCRPLSIPIVCTNHTRYDLYAKVYLPFVPQDVAEKMLQVYLSSFYKDCNLVIAPSAGMRDVLNELGIAVPVEVVPNGVDLQPFRQVKQPVDRALFGFTSEDVVLIYVGRVSKEKNVDLLLESFEYIAPAVPTARLLIVGDGPEREDLVEWVKENNLRERVYFTGLIPYEQLPAYLAAADAFATASVTEVHPLTVIEAMAAGLPVVGIASPGVSDTVEHESSGLLAQNEDDFSDQILRIVRDHDGRRQMAERARRVADTYSIERNAQAMLAHYEKLVAQRDAIEAWSGSV